jgi:hypothetical protein
MKLVKLAKESEKQEEGGRISSRRNHWLVLDGKQRVVGELCAPNYADLEVVEESPAPPSPTPMPSSGY